MVNTIAAVSGTSWRFILGLGITQVADAIAQQGGGLGTAAAIVIDAIAIGFFVLMGKLAGDAKKWAFILGMVAFGLDGLLSLLAKDFISLAFRIRAVLHLSWVRGRERDALGQGDYSVNTASASTYANRTSDSPW